MEPARMLAACQADRSLRVTRLRRPPSEPVTGAFDGAVYVRAVKCASTGSLLRALNQLRPDLELDIGPSERAPRLGKQRDLWKRFHAGAKLAVRKGLLLELLRF